MGALDVECDLTDADGKLFFETGDISQSQSRMYDSHDVQAGASNDANEIFRVRQRNSRFSLHNHPARPEFNGEQAVSFADYKYAKALKKDMNFLVVRDGVIGFNPGEHTTFFPGISALREGKDSLLRSNLHVLKLVFQNPERSAREQKEAGIMDFFVPFRGDEDSERKLQAICDYINNPAAQWSEVKPMFE